MCIYATGMLTCMYMRHIQVCILSCIYTRINVYIRSRARVYIRDGYIYAKGSIHTQQTRLEACAEFESGISAELSPTVFR